MSFAPTRPEAAETFLSREYGRLRPDVLGSVRSRLRTQGIALDDSDLDAFYNQAWHALYDRLADGAEIENRSGFLVTVAYRRAIEECRRLRPDERAHGADPAAAGVDPDLAGRLDDQVRLRQLVEGMKERLDERECKAASLCLIHGFTRPEAADILGESPKRFEKVMDGVQRKLSSLTTVITDGAWCEDRRSLIKAYALGLFPEDSARRALAVEHLESCSACRRYVQGVRGLTAVVPPVVLPVAAMHAAQLAGTGVAGAGAAAAHAAGGHASGPVVFFKAAAATTGVVAVAGVGLALVGVIGRSDKPAATTIPPPAAAVSPPPIAVPAATPKPKPTPAAKPKPKRRRSKPKRRAVPRPRPVAAAPEPPVATPAAAPAPAPAPAPKPPIVTDAAQEFGP